MSMTSIEKQIKVDCKWCKHEGILYKDIELQTVDGIVHNFVCKDQDACDQRDADANSEED